MSDKKHIAVLLDGPIKNDYRVIKMIHTLSAKIQVDLFYINASDADGVIFNNKVKLFNVAVEKTRYLKLIKHTFFVFEFNFFIKKVLNNSVNYTHVIANDLPTLYAANKIADKLKAKLIYDSHEIYIETINQFFPATAPFYKMFIFKFCMFVMKTSGSFYERIILKKANCLIAVNESLANYFKRKYQVKKIAVIMNFPNHNNSDFKEVDYRQKFSWNETDKIFIYQGVLNEGRGLKILISAFIDVPANCKLIIIGDGVLKKELCKSVAENNISEKVKFMNKVPLKLLPNYTRAADYGVNLLEDYNLSKKLASPNKLFEYIHAEIPVICSKTIENEKVLKKYNVGISTTNEIVNVVKSIKSIININKDEFSFIKAKEAFSWEQQEKTIFKIINE